MKLNKYWFKPKNYGYGVYPATIEGWLLTFLYLFFIFLMGYYFIEVDKKWFSFFFYIIIFSTIFVYTSRKKTKEEWKWRWGKSSEHKKRKK